MGCASSKRIEAAVVTDVVYRPAPSSFALFDINSIEEPWLKSNNKQEEEEKDEKRVNVPAPILEKLTKFELANDGPHSWSEVSKALEELKPSLHNNNQKPVSLPTQVQAPIQENKSLTNSQSFHTLVELDKKLSSSKPTQLKKSESMFEFESKRSDSLVGIVAPPITEGIKPIKENLFIVKDRMERGKDGKTLQIIKSRKDPLSEYPEKCPPGGADSVVLYTTTLRGVRRTFEDCNRTRSVIDIHRVVIDERDVSLHGQFLNELRELLGEGVSVPRLFIKGRYIGGVDEVVELNEYGKLSELLNSVGRNREAWNSVCEGCGGTRFVPCFECGGSCKVLIGDKKERCVKCNENGLVQCPVCH